MSGKREKQVGKRLLAAADMVRDGAILADIGTDHGYLACMLVENGKCPRAYACDINPLPLRAAEKNIRLAGLQDKIICVLGDGLVRLGGVGISDFAILGMGGDLIADILTRCDWVRDSSLRFILQPMSKPDRLRRALYMAGFAVESEKAVVEGRFVYSVMCALYTGESKEICELFAHTGLIKSETDEVSALYLRRAATKLQKKADGLLLSGKSLEKAAFYADLSKKILPGPSEVAYTRSAPTK